MEDTARGYLASYEEEVKNYHIYSLSRDLEKRELAKELRTKAIDIAKSYNSYLKENRQVWGDYLPRGLPENLSTDF
jgi:RNA-splicing ligase RtcB